MGGSTVLEVVLEHLLFQVVSRQVQGTKEQVDGMCYDMDYAAQCLKDVDVIPQLQNIQGWLKNGLINAGQLKDLNEKVTQRKKELQRERTSSTSSITSNIASGLIN